MRRTFCALFIILSAIITAASARASENQDTLSCVKEAPLPDPAITAPAGPEGTAAVTTAQIYTNDEAGVVFAVPDGWRRTDIADETPDITAGFGNAGGNMIFFRCRDIWAGISDNVKWGFSRRDLDNRIFTESDIRDMFTDYGTAVLRVETETVNAIDYFKITNITIGSGMDHSISWVSFRHAVNSDRYACFKDSDRLAAGPGMYGGETVISHVLFYDGIMYQFSCTGGDEAEAYGDYLSLLDSIRFKNLKDYAPDHASDGIYGLLEGGKSGLSVLMNIYYLISFMTLNFLPVIIYRYGVRKTPTENVKAALISMTLGILAYGLAICLGIAAQIPVLAGAVMLGSIINFSILRGGKAPVSRLISGICRQYGPASYLYGGTCCRNCGARLLPGSVFCDKCGFNNNNGGFQI